MQLGNTAIQITKLGLGCMSMSEYYGNPLREEDNIAVRGIDNSYEYILSACQKSLNRLGKEVKYIDLFYLHRISQQGAQLDEAMRAMSELLDQGKIKSVGLSEANPGMIKTANAALLKYTDGKHSLAAIQSEYSLLSRRVEKDGVLDTCRELSITFIAYSPLSRALLTGEIEDSSHFQEIDFRRNLPRFRDDELV